MNMYSYIWPISKVLPFPPLPLALVARIVRAAPLAPRVQGTTQEHFCSCLINKLTIGRRVLRAYVFASTVSP